MDLSWVLVVRGAWEALKPSVLTRDGLGQVPDGRESVVKERQEDSTTLLPHRDTGEAVLVREGSKGCA